MSSVVLAVDIGGTKIAVARVVEGVVVERREAPTPSREGPQAVIRTVLSLIEDWKLKAAGLGVASGGVISRGRVIHANPRILPDWEGLDLRAVFRATTGLVVEVLNDAQAAAWGEYRYGAGRGLESLAFVTVSTGIGAGLVLGGQLLTGATGLAGHLGHTAYAPEGEVCGCGRRGCLETVTSGLALAEAARRRLGIPLDARMVLARAQDGDPEALALVDRAAAALAQALADLQALVDPEAVVLGGGVGLNPFYRERLEAALAHLPHIFRPRLRLAALGANSGLLGVADWVRQGSDR
ncbi:MAG: N-acetylmannosamine kinase [Armatimonadota bacterium]|nr:N-acetylmannosamine kinase [Armatimonadota bacterium]MDR7438651.1 N-acetylmannosamine kinase [Armatimonadota bacterium]MDR7562628.1 N-acetylmannosamine kinase [Armatimonadota bacterium]MDR7602974.1 N-acetylmannosamine kinase [Armatimonadota bacterium]